MNTELIRAIVDRRLIEFAYKGGRIRSVEPHDHGIRRGVEQLLAYQISGESRSGAPHGWKHFDVDGMTQLRLLDRRFPGSRADSNQHHGEWDTLFRPCEVIAHVLLSERSQFLRIESFATTMPSSSEEECVS